MGYNSKYTGSEIESLLEGAGIAKDKATQASIDSQEAIRQAQVATNAVATLEGLSNTSEAQQTLAAQVTQIAQNTSDIASIKDSRMYLTRSQYNDLESQGLISDDVEYNIFEDDN